MTDASIDAILTFSPWDTWRDARLREFCRPPDQAYKSLVRSRRVDRLLVADPWRSRPLDLLRRIQGRRAEFPSSTRVSHLRPLGWRRHEPTDVKAVERRYRHYGTLLKRAAQERSIDVPALVTFNPFVAAFAPLDWCRTIIYYGRDDWSEFGRNTKLIDALRAAQVAMTSRGVTVCAVSRALADRVAGPGRGVVIPNGIDADTWSSHKPVPETLRALKRPIGIYAGTVDDRLDVPALRELARSGSLQTIAVVGPVTDEVVRRQLAEAPSIRLVGRLNQRDLQGALMGADVCLLPHVVTPLTEAMSPLKLYEYLAAGCPVVSTDLPPVRDVHERVILVSDGDYAKAVHTALALGRLDEDERLAIVEANSWANRHEKLIDLMFGAAAN